MKGLVKSLESAPVGDGDLIGEPFKCLPYQRKFLDGAFKPGILRAGLTLARGGGKSGLASALALDSIRPAGVLHVVGGETVIVASSFAQARIIFEAVKTSLELMGEDGEYRIRDQQNLADIQHRTTKARLRVAGSDNRRAHGWRFNLAIVDEPAQHGPRGEILAAAIRPAGEQRGILQQPPDACHRQHHSGLYRVPGRHHGPGRGGRGSDRRMPHVEIWNDSPRNGPLGTINVVSAQAISTSAASTWATCCGTGNTGASALRLRARYCRI